MRLGLKKWKFFFLAVCAALFLLCGFDSQEKKVYDDGELLTEAEEEELQKLLVSGAQNTEQDLVIVTTDDNGGKEARDYADDFYDQHGFGYEKENGSGVLFLIDMDARTIYISTAGTAIEKYTDMEIEDTLDAIMPSMRSGDYGEACRTFISEAIRCLNGGDVAEDGYYDEKTDRFVEKPADGGWKQALSFKRLAILFSVSAALAAFVVLIISWKRKTRMSVNGGTYLKDGKVDFRERRDQFTHTTVVTRHIPKNNGGGGSSGGGHSSYHTSSGGHSHGGGGRSF